MKVDQVSSLEGHTDSVWCCAWSSDGNTLATCGTDKAIRLWTEQDEKWVCKTILSDGHSRTIRRVSWSPCGNMLASCSFDGTVCVWTKKDGEFECSITLEGHENEVKSAEFSPSGRYLATCSRDKTVWIWEQGGADDFECVSVQSCHTQDVKCVRWHPREDILASASYDNSINFYKDEGDDWASDATATGHDSTVWSIAFDREGDKVVSGSDDQTLRIWKRYQAGNQAGIAPSWKCITTLQGYHTRPVYDVSWCHVTGLIASGCGDNKVRFFAPDPEQVDCQVADAPNFVLAASVDAHRQDVNCVQWNPTKAGLLASAGDDEVVKLWKVSDYEVPI